MLRQKTFAETRRRGYDAEREPIPDRKAAVCRMKKAVLKCIRVLVLLFALYLLVSLIVPPLFQKEPEPAEAHSTGAGERVLCIDDNRDALVWRLRLIGEAEHEIILSTFDFRTDNSGTDLLAALNDAAERGVDVKILVDGLSGDRNLRRSELVGALASHSNVQIRLYNPLDLLTPWKINYRLHDKYLIADGTQYLLGGRNTNDLFLGEYRDREDRNMDREVLVLSAGEAEGSAGEAEGSAGELGAYFAKIWDEPCCEAISGSRKNREAALETLRSHFEETRGRYPEAYSPADWQSGMPEARSVTLLSNPTAPENKAPMLWEQLCGILERGEHIWIETPYAICDDRMLDALSRLCGDGRRVQILTNAPESGANIFGCAEYRNEKPRLLAAGCEIFEAACAQSLHTKTVLVDDSISVIGSYNLDPRSTYLDTELMLVIDCPELNHSLRETASARAAQSRRVLPDGTETEGPDFEASMPLSKKAGYAILRIFTGLFRYLR